jgi:hypothetical protein
MIDRRTWLRSFGGILPIAATVHVEAAPIAGDLVVITVPGICSQETATRITETMERHLPAGVKAVVLVEGMTLHVERAITAYRRG